MSIRVEVAAPTVAIAGDRALSIAGFVGLLIAMAIGGWGVQWDIRWHLLIGRDSFWIAPHVMTYAGVTLSATIAFGMLALERVRGRASQGWWLEIGRASCRGRGWRGGGGGGDERRKKEYRVENGDDDGA